MPADQVSFKFSVLIPASVGPLPGRLPSPSFSLARLCLSAFNARPPPPLKPIKLTTSDFIGSLFSNPYCNYGHERTFSPFGGSSLVCKLD